jgi:two-component system sensor kinase FixL
VRDILCIQNKLRHLPQCDQATPGRKRAAAPVTLGLLALAVLLLALASRELRLLPLGRIRTIASGLVVIAGTLILSAGGLLWIFRRRAAALASSGPRVDFGRGGELRMRRAPQDRHRDRAILENEARQAAIITSALDCIIAMDHRGIVTEFNPAAENTFGYKRAEAVGKPLAELIVPPALREKHRRGLERYMQTGVGKVVGTRLEMTAMKADGGEFPVELTVTVINLDGPPSFIAYLRDLTERKRSEAEREAMQERLLESSRQAGMAEIATGVLHNVGNVLNSVNVSACLLSETLRGSKLESLDRVAGLLREQGDNLGQFITSDARGRQLPGYLLSLAEVLNREQKGVIVELEALMKNVEHIKTIVNTQQGYARPWGVAEPISISELVEDALGMSSAAFERHGIAVVREFGEVPAITLDRQKLLLILINLIRNAKHSICEQNAAEKRLTIRIGSSADDGRLRIDVIDTGLGISPENLGRIFSHGFPPKKDGHGFGLHSSALAAAEMGGTLCVHSDGPGAGARFTLELPVRQQLEMAA